MGFSDKVTILRPIRLHWRATAHGQFERIQAKWREEWNCKLPHHDGGRDGEAEEFPKILKSFTGEGFEGLVEPRVESDEGAEAGDFEEQRDVERIRHTFEAQLQLVDHEPTQGHMATHGDDGGDQQEEHRSLRLEEFDERQKDCLQQ